MGHDNGAMETINGRRASSEWHRRLALGLSAQLPDNAEDARAVLDCVGELVETFLYPPTSAGAGAAEIQDRVLLFAGAPAGISSCRTR
jgi:hypothetical protein